MRLILILIVALCVIGVSAHAEMQQDVINRDVVGSAVNDYGLFLLPVNNGDGYQVNSPDGTKNATWKHDGTNAVFDASSGVFSFADPVKLSGEVSLPACTSATEGQISYYKSSTAPGFMVSCIDNGGLYELIPVGQGTAGFLWTVIDFDGDATDRGLIYDSNVWYESPTGDHNGIVMPFTAATGTDAGYAVALVNGGSSSSHIIPAGYTNYTVEWIVKPNDTTSVRYLVGISSEVNVAVTSEDLAIFRFDTDNLDTTWQAVTRDNTTETETVTDTGVTVTAGNWYRMIIVRNGNEVRFYLGVNGADVTLEATHTTNLPNSSNLSPYVEVREKTAAQRDIGIDYYRLSMLGLDR